MSSSREVSYAVPNSAFKFEIIVCVPGAYTPETMFPNRRKCTRDIRCRSCRNGRFSQTRQKVEFYYSAAPFGRVFFFQFADIWNVFAESCRQVNLMVLLIDEDLPNLFGHREFAQMLTLADTLAIVADGFAFVFQVEAEHFFWVLRGLYWLGRHHRHFAEVTPQPVKTSQDPKEML